MTRALTTSARPSLAARRPSSWITAGLGGLFAVMWLGGIVSYLFKGGVPPGSEWAAPSFLALAAVLLLASAAARTRPALIAAGVLGFIVEWIGHTGGWLFGRYVYTEILAPSLLGVPVVMVSAWMVLAAYVHSRLAGRRLPWVAATAIGAGLLTAVDVVIDPLAAGPLGYWRWLDGGPLYGVPLSNFAGWFVSGALILAVMRAMLRDDEEIRGAGAVGGSIVLFFTVLAAGHGLVLPALAGCAVLAVHLALAGWRVR